MDTWCKYLLVTRHKHPLVAWREQPIIHEHLVMQSVNRHSKLRPLVVVTNQKTMTSRQSACACSKMTSQRVRDALVAEHEKVLKAQADNELLQVCPDDVT